MHITVQCAISTLADHYVEGPYTVPPVARAALASTYVSSGNLTLSDYISRSQARITVSDIHTCALLSMLLLYLLRTLCIEHSTSALLFTSLAQEAVL